jgi:hypothetical protein
MWGRAFVSIKAALPKTKGGGILDLIWNSAYSPGHYFPRRISRHRGTLKIAAKLRKTARRAALFAFLDGDVLHSGTLLARLS